MNREKRIGVGYCVGLLLIVLVWGKRTLSPAAENGMTLIESLRGAGIAQWLQRRTRD